MGEKKADKKPDKKTEKKAEKKEAKAPKADPKKDPITFEQYVKTLPSRGLAGSDVFTKKRTQKAWDVESIKLSGKLSASAIEASDELRDLQSFARVCQPLREETTCS